MLQKSVRLFHHFLQLLLAVLVVRAGFHVVKLLIFQVGVHLSVSWVLGCSLGPGRFQQNRAFVSFFLLPVHVGRSIRLGLRVSRQLFEH